VQTLAPVYAALSLCDHYFPFEYYPTKAKTRNYNVILTRAIDFIRNKKETEKEKKKEHAK